MGIAATADVLSLLETRMAAQCNMCTHCAACSCKASLPSTALRHRRRRNPVRIPSLPYNSTTLNSQVSACMEGRRSRGCSMQTGVAPGKQLEPNID